MSVTPAQVESIVLPFYRYALTVNDETSPGEVLSRILSADFLSMSSQGSKTREMLINQLGAFWKLIPDLKWEPQEVLVSGDRVTVRSVATGTPKGNFFGVEADGTRSFHMDTIDIHHVADGTVRGVYHVEDWASAVKQVRG